MTETPLTGPSAARLKGLYHQLIALGERHNVPRQDAEELANDTLLTVIGKFDPARGRAEPFAHTVMMNKVRNFARDHKLPPTVPFDDERHADPLTPEEYVTRLEDITMIRQTRARLLSALSDEEARFLLEYEEVLDDLGDRAVSETARRLDLTPQDGHNIRQRIERKARKIAARVSGETGPKIRRIVKSDVETVASEALPELAILDRLMASPSRKMIAGSDLILDLCRAGLALSNEGLDRFLGKLDTGSRDRLLSFLS